MEYNKDEIIKEFRDWSKFRVQGVWKDSIEKLIIQFIEERLVKKLTLTDVSNCTQCNTEINYKGVCEMCYTESKLNDLD